MGQVIYNNAGDLLKGIKTQFMTGMEASRTSSVGAFTYMGTSSEEEEQYLFGDMFGGVKEWIDEVEFNSLNAYDYRIVNKDYAGGVKVLRNKLKDGMSVLGGAIEMQINAKIMAYQNIADKLINALIVANGNAFDGTAMFAVDRPLLKGADAIDNLHTGRYYPGTGQS